MERLQVLTGYLILILVFFYALMVLIGMCSGKIDLSSLLSEADGTASMSRFQLLIFTFIIGLSIFLMVVASKTPKFPVVPKEILTLLGISATTYVASKGIQFSRPEGLQKKPTCPPPGSPNPPGGTPLP